MATNIEFTREKQVPASLFSRIITLSLMHIVSYAISVPMFINLTLD